MKRLAILLLLLAAIVNGFLVLNRWGKDRVNGKTITQNDIRICFYQLEAIDLSVSTTLARAKIEQGTNLTIQEAVTRIAGKKGYGFFQCGSPRNWVRMNPDGGKWNNSDEYPNEIALYSVVLLDKKTTSGQIVGVNFRGEHVNLTQPPDWTPIPVWEVERKTNAKE